MDKILCWLGIHDWVILDWRYSYSKPRTSTPGLLYKRVCIRCGKCDDQIQQEKERKILENERLIMAKAMWKESKRQDQPNLEECLYRYGYDRTDARSIANIYHTRGFEESLRVIVDWDDTKHDYTGELRKAIKQWENER